MNRSNAAIIILAAGHGTRMRSAAPKVLHEIVGKSMLAHVIDAASSLAPEKIVVVIGDHARQVGEAAQRSAPDAIVVVQAPPRGTGDAARCALPALDGFDGVALIMFADTPLLTTQTLARLLRAAKGRAGAALGFRPSDPGAYGRFIQDAGGALVRIVEAADAAPDERAIGLCNAGAMAVSASFLRRAVPKISPDNAKNEFYLTDIIGMAHAEGSGFDVVEADASEVMGVNSRAELALAERIAQDRLRRAAMEAGATLIDPSTVYFSHDTALGRDVRVEPGVWFGPGVAVGEGATIKAYSHIEGARINAGAVVGPFARLRPGAEIGAGAHIGNYVEVKNARIGEGAKANHLSYIGDATVGAGANIGAGVITCNYDGYRKHRTDIGENAFIGSNSALVAPVSIGAGAYVGSGSVITRNVDPDDLAVARGRQAEIKGWAAAFRRSNGDGRNRS